MKPRRERSENMRVMRLWDWNEATKAVPYLHSIVDSLRECWLEVRKVQRQLERSVHCEPNRQYWTELETRQGELRRAQGKFDDALDELNDVDTFLIDPVNGLALLPFRKDDDLAWYVFDHFAPIGLVGWRFHDDPISKCRPLNSKDTAVANSGTAI